MSTRLREGEREEGRKGARYSREGKRAEGVEIENDERSRAHVEGEKVIRKAGGEAQIGNHGLRQHGCGKVLAGVAEDKGPLSPHITPCPLPVLPCPVLRITLPALAYLCWFCSIAPQPPVLHSYPGPPRDLTMRGKLRMWGYVLWFGCFDSSITLMSLHLDEGPLSPHACTSNIGQCQWPWRAETHSS